MGLKIIDTSRYLPENKVSNRDLEEKMETTDEWIYKRTGIKARCISLDEDTSSLAVSVCRKLNILDRENIRAVIVATSTSDSIMPNLASIIHKRLNLDEKCFSMDINMACSGFVAGIKTIEAILKQGEYGIVVGAEVLSKIIDWNDRATSILFGDGAGAVLVKKTNEDMFFDYGTIGDLEKLSYGGIDLNLEHRLLSMDGKEVYRFAVDCIYKSVNNLLDESGLDISEIDYIISHQANKRILEKVSKKLKVDENKFYSNIENVGNTSSASIPILLDEMNTQKLLEGKKIILIGFGAGLTWSSTLFRW